MEALAEVAYQKYGPVEYTDTSDDAEISSVSASIEEYDDHDNEQKEDSPDTYQGLMESMRGYFILASKMGKKEQSASRRCHICNGLSPPTRAFMCQSGSCEQLVHTSASSSSSSHRGSAANRKGKSTSRKHASPGGIVICSREPCLKVLRDFFNFQCPVCSKLCCCQKLGNWTTWKHKHLEANPICPCYQKRSLSDKYEAPVNYYSKSGAIHNGGHNGKPPTKSEEYRNHKQDAGVADSGDRHRHHDREVSTEQESDTFSTDTDDSGEWGMLVRLQQLCSTSTELSRDSEEKRICHFAGCIRYYRTFMNVLLEYLQACMGLAVRCLCQQKIAIQDLRHALSPSLLKVFSLKTKSGIDGLTIQNRRNVSLLYKIIEDKGRMTSLVQHLGRRAAVSRRNAIYKKVVDQDADMLAECGFTSRPMQLGAADACSVLLCCVGGAIDAEQSILPQLLQRLGMRPTTRRKAKHLDAALFGMVSYISEENRTVKGSLKQLIQENMRTFKRSKREYELAHRVAKFRKPSSAPQRNDTENTSRVEIKGNIDSDATQLAESAGSRRTTALQTTLKAQMISDGGEIQYYKAKIAQQERSHILAIDQLGQFYKSLEATLHGYCSYLMGLHEGLMDQDDGSNFLKYLGGSIPLVSVILEAAETVLSKSISVEYEDVLQSLVSRLPHKANLYETVEEISRTLTLVFENSVKALNSAKAKSVSVHNSHISQKNACCPNCISN
eukprot:gb/GECG01011871.1/.p1 GENE.gb/GECG01011871.1/~~gb/GECG01011871.1/.p1  ORF type:complete len:726 (+),score=79.02 gb/GECG01011871.1/:1-2178(+)